MRHRVAHRKLGRKTEHRLSLLKNLCASLIVHERLVTTLPKAKELRPFAERAITLGKRALSADAPEAALHARRQAASYFHSGNTNRIPDGGYKRPHAPRTAGVAALDKLFDDIASRFADRPGGYTRILKLGARRGDGAEMALIELIGSESSAAVHEEEKKEEKKSRRFFGRGKKADAEKKEEPKKSAKASRNADAPKTAKKSEPAAKDESKPKAGKKKDSSK